MPSRCLLIADPQHVETPIRVEPTATDRGRIRAECLAYSRDGFNIASVTVRFSEPDASWEMVSSLGIDSAKALLIDEEDYKAHWTETGPDRIGVISMARSDRLLRELTKRFGFKARRVNAVKAEVIGPVSEELEAEVEAYLKDDPDYGLFTFMGFHVRTNNSFDRVNYMSDIAAFLPIGNAPSPTLFAFTTGYGDGSYPVFVRRSGDEVAEVRIDFIDPETREQFLVDPQYDAGPD